MKCVLISVFLLASSLAFARNCPVACGFISDEGIPTAGCGENRQLALIEGMYNCTVLVQEAMKKSGVPLGTYVIDSCKIKNARYTEVDCQDYAAWDAFEKMWNDKTCTVRKTVSVLGVPLWSSEAPCGDKYTPDYNYSGGKFH